MRNGYPTDLKDEEWEIIEALVPPACPGGRPRTTDMREVLNAIFYPSPLARAIYINLIQFAELHPTKIKVGVIAPEKGQYKATGTEGVSVAESDFQNFDGEPGKVIDLVRRCGSTSVTYGAERRTTNQHASE